MQKLLTILLCCYAFSGTFGSTKYKIDEDAIERLFENTVEISLLVINHNESANSFNCTLLSLTDDDDHGNKQMIAGIFAAAEFITGFWFLPIHRAYLGTNGGVIVGYVCTLGGCGIITFIDAIVLLLDGEGNKYIDNNKFFMW